MADFFARFTSYGFLVVAFGTMILATASAMIGTISVLKGQSLIGDAISHSAWPGIVLAFMIFNTREPLILTLGALISGGFAFYLIQVLHRNSKVSLDTLMAIILSSMFGLGMVLKTYIDSGKFTNASQAGLNHYIFGQAAYLMIKDVYLIAIVSIISLLLLLIFYKEIKAYVFDSVHAHTIGIKPSFFYGILLVMTMALISVGMKVVGAILISSMLIAPGITGLMWSNRFGHTLIIAGVVGAISALIGTYMSTYLRGFSTGPTIILIMSVVCVVSLLLSPKGIIRTIIKRKRNRKKLLEGGGND